MGSRQARITTLPYRQLLVDDQAISGFVVTRSPEVLLELNDSVGEPA